MIYQCITIKIVIDLLTETCMLGCKPSDTPVDGRKKTDDGGNSVKIDKYQRLAEKLIYLSHARPDIAFAISLVSQHMHSSNESHLETVYKILKYLKSSMGKELLFKKSERKKVEIFTNAD